MISDQSSVSAMDDEVERSVMEAARFGDGIVCWDMVEMIIRNAGVVTREMGGSSSNPSKN